MFFHIGERQCVSLNTIIGIFSREAIENSHCNDVYKDEIKESTRSLIIDEDDEVIVSSINSVTLIQRSTIQEIDYLWKRSR